jgi:site-specific recombinase
MTRILELTGPRASIRFRLLWTALMTGGDGKDRTPVVIRKEARLHTTLEALSVPTNGNELERTLSVEDARLTLSQEDFDLLQQYTEKTAWTPHTSRDVVDLWDWLSAADKQD